jgi:DNA-binding XRE family transcriptional regulator
MESWKPEDIKRLKNKYSLSQRTLGDLLGVSRNYIYYLERGEKTPSKSLKLLLDCVEEKLSKKGG